MPARRIPNHTISRHFARATERGRPAPAACGSAGAAAAAGPGMQRRGHVQPGETDRPAGAWYRPCHREMASAAAGRVPRARRAPRQPGAACCRRNWDGSTRCSRRSRRRGRRSRPTAGGCRPTRSGWPRSSAWPDDVDRDHPARGAAARCREDADAVAHPRQAGPAERPRVAGAEDPPGAGHGNLPPVRVRRRGVRHRPLPPRALRRERVPGPAGASGHPLHRPDRRA